MASSWMLCHVALVRTNISEEHDVTSQKTPFFSHRCENLKSYENIYRSTEK
jgi:hypothetical protein